jgi:hypothetical protein
MGYMGASVYLTANDLSNEGQITAAQYPFQVRECALGNVYSVSPTCVLQSKIVSVTKMDNPSYSSLVKMPNVYTGEAKEGCYMPLKLDGNHQQWHDERDKCRFIPISDNDLYSLPTAAPGVISPYLASQGAYATTASPNINGDMHLLPCTENLGRIVCRGLNVAAKITIVVRFGFECQVQPDSAYASFLAVCPEYDMIAVETYYKIARRLKDAYPVSYNDFGKLWNVIKGAAKAVAPVLSVVPGGEMITTLGKGIGSMVDMAQEKPSKAPTAPANGPSAVELEEAVKGAMSKYAPKRVLSIKRKAQPKSRPKRL